MIFFNYVGLCPRMGLQIWMQLPMGNKNAVRSSGVRVIHSLQATQLECLELNLGLQRAVCAHNHWAISAAQLLILQYVTLKFVCVIPEIVCLE